MKKYKIKDFKKIINYTITTWNNNHYQKFNKIIQVSRKESQNVRKHFIYKIIIHFIKKYINDKIIKALFLIIFIILTLKWFYFFILLKKNLFILKFKKKQFINKL